MNNIWLVINNKFPQTCGDLPMLLSTQLLLSHPVCDLNIVIHVDRNIIVCTQYDWSYFKHLTDSLVFWHISNMAPMTFWVKFVIIPSRFVYQQYLRNIDVQPVVGCYNVWANICCSGCSPLGENRCEKGILKLCLIFQHFQNGRHFEFVANFFYWKCYRKLNTPAR